MTTMTAIDFTELFVIDPTSESGLKWRTSGTGRRPDLRVGSPDTPGYWKLKYKNKFLGVHRVIWEMLNGPIPSGYVIDHINGDPADNRVENLRLASPSQNARNSASRAERFLPKGIYHTGSHIIGRVAGRAVGSDVLVVLDNSSERLNDLLKAAHDAILEAHGEFANVSSFYSSVPDEACMGPDTGHP